MVLSADAIGSWLRPPSIQSPLANLRNESFQTVFSDDLFVDASSLDFTRSVRATISVQLITP